MFFDFSIFGILSYIGMFLFFYFWVIKPGKKGRKRRRTAASSPSLSPEETRYPAGTKIHRNYDVCREIFREENKNGLKRKGIFLREILSVPTGATRRFTSIPL